MECMGFGYVCVCVQGQNAADEMRAGTHRFHFLLKIIYLLFMR